MQELESQSDEVTTEEQLEGASESAPLEETVPLRRKRKIRREVFSIIIIVFGVFLFRSVLYEPFRIPSGSMIPTLKIGDFILVNKFSYGFKLPFSDINLLGFNGNPIYLFGKEDPKRGDVVVFKYPKDPSVNYIKRVVAVPGDVIEIVDKKLLINGKRLNVQEEVSSKFMDDMDEKFRDYNLRFFKVSNGKDFYHIQIDEDNFYRTDYEAKRVPEGKFFVMGDNRDFSHDSRYWGFVPRENIKGKAFLVWFSMIFPMKDESFRFRPWRIGESIR